MNIVSIVPAHGENCLPLLRDHQGPRTCVPGPAGPSLPRLLAPEVRPPLAVRLCRMRKPEALPRSLLLWSEAGVLLPRLRRRASRRPADVLGVDLFLSTEVPLAGRVARRARPTRARSPASVAAPPGL